jgi:hypothetical protein
MVIVRSAGPSGPDSEAGIKSAETIWHNGRLNPAHVRAL